MYRTITEEPMAIYDTADDNEESNQISRDAQKTAESSSGKLGIKLDSVTVSTG